jgi:hypothetical protein
MVALMADDRDLIIGEVREAVRSIRKHLERQDEVSLVRDQQLEINKREAIKAREEKDGRDESRYNALSGKLTDTGGKVSAIEKRLDEQVEPVLTWHRDEGSKLGGRVSVLEQINNAETAAKAQADRAQAERRGETKGRWAVWSMVAGAVVAVASFLGWLGADKLAAMFLRLGTLLGH